MRRALPILLALGLLIGAGSTRVGAQEEPPTSGTTTTVVELPPAEIVPRPNSGTAPQEAGDRGGALQLGVLALVVVAIGGTVARLVLQARRPR